MKSECIACAGSGRYDDTGSPPCGACNGTGEIEDPDLKEQLEEMQEKMKNYEKELELLRTKINNLDVRTRGHIPIGPTRYKR